MAIVILGKTGCSLCGTILSGTDEIVMFPHFIGDEAHPLWRFSDSAMHRSCFAGWSHAEEFRSAYNEIWLTKPDHAREMTADGSIVELDSDPTA